MHGSPDFRTCPSNVLETAHLHNQSHVYKAPEDQMSTLYSEDYCPMVFDSLLCWPRTKAGEKVWQKCPDGVRGLDGEKNVSRQCLPGGTWFYCPGPNISLGVGWTNWSHCWSASTEKIMADLNQKAICPSDENQDNSAEIKFYVAEVSRVLEMIGYAMSLLVLIFALGTFCYFRKLRKPRVTRIHMNLFASMILQCVVRLVIYADQLIVRQPSQTNVKNPENLTTTQSAPSSSPDQVWGIDNTPLLCEFFYTLIEYGKTTTFLWMFIEGIILYHMTTVAYSRGPEHQPLFYLFGWLLPVPLTIAWLIAKSYEAETDLNYCGASSYINLKSYWILEGPRFAAFILNILILLSVIRVLVTHLSCNEILDTNQIKKSAKSLFFLLPLLGISNVLHFVWPNPLRGSWQSFAVWSITSHFLSSFQGLFVASVYFLFDDKVKDTLYKFWVLKVRLRDWGGTGEGETGGLNNTIGFARDRSFNYSRAGSQCRSNETHIYRNRDHLMVHDHTCIETVEMKSFIASPSSLSHGSCRKSQVRHVKMPVKKSSSKSSTSSQRPSLKAVGRASLRSSDDIDNCEEIENENEMNAIDDRIEVHIESFNVDEQNKDSTRPQENLEIPNSKSQYSEEHINGIPKSKDFSKVSVVVDFEPHDDIVRHRITLRNNIEKLL